MEQNENEILQHKKEDSLYKITINSLKMFIKVYGIRVVYKFIKTYAKGKNIQKTVLNLATPKFKNIRTSLFVSLLPFLYQILKRILSFISKNFNLSFLNMNIITFISAFISAFISISFEQKSKVVDYIVLSIMVRVIHTLLHIICKKYNIFQKTGKKFDYFIFLLAAIAMFTVHFLNPGFLPITKLFDTYGNYIDKSEKEEMLLFRNTIRIV